MSKKTEAAADNQAEESVAVKRPWSFPEEGVVIEAATLEEAQAELAKRKASRE